MIMSSHWTVIGVGPAFHSTEWQCKVLGKPERIFLLLSLRVRHQTSDIIAQNIVQVAAMDSQPPLPRTSLSDTSAPPLGPMPLFDAHLRILSDSYLGFFQERCVLLSRVPQFQINSLM